METSRPGSLPQVSSSLGYRVVEITEEKVPPRPESATPRPSSTPPTSNRAPAQSKPSDWWVAALAAGIFTMVIGFVMVLATCSVDVTPPRVVERPDNPCINPTPWTAAFPTAVIPAALAARPGNLEDEKAEPALQAGDNVEVAPVADKGDRETFDTSVEFVRNPLEAGRLANAERKLAFHLHVSGNFEDAAFT